MPELSVAGGAFSNMTGHSEWSHGYRRLGSRGLPEMRGAAALAPTARFEGYGPGTAALLVDCVTTDRERTAETLRRLFARHGGALGAAGSVSYLFQPVAQLAFAAGADTRSLAAAALEAGAEEAVTHTDGSVDVLADPAECTLVRERLIGLGFHPESTELTERAAVAARLEGGDARLMLTLLDALERLPEVRNVYTNVEISDPGLARL